MATDLLSLSAKIGIDDSEYNKGIAGAESKAKKLGSGLKSAFKVGAAAIGVTTAAIGGLAKGIYSQAKATSEYGDNVDKMSQKIGISAEAYQKWDYVMQRAGGDVNSLKMGMKTLSQQAENNSDAFQKLGISQEEVASSSQEELLQKTIVGLSKMEASTERTALATKLLGRAGADMGPLLNQGSEAIEEQMKIAEDYGMIMSDEAVKASADFQDSLTTLSQTTTGLKNRLMGELLPGITSITDGLALMFTSDGQEEGLAKFNEGLTTTINNVVDLIPKIVDIGVPILETIASGIISNLPTLASAVVSIANSTVTYLIQELPTLFSAGIDIIMAIINGITENLPLLSESVVSAVTQIAELLTNPDTLTMLIEGLLAMMNALAESMSEAIPVLAEAIPTIVQNIVTFLLQAMPLLLTAGVQIIVTLAQGIIQNLPQMMPTIVMVITSLVTMLTNPDMLVQLVTAALDIVLAIANGLIAAIPQLLAVIPTLISNLVSAIIRLAPKIGKTGIQLISALLKGIKGQFSKLGKMGKDIIDKIKKSIKEKLDDAKTWGKDLIDNFVKGFKEKWEQLKSNISAVADWIKGLFHHSTPDFGPLKDDDKWMPDMMDNFIEGIDSKVPELARSVENAAGTVSNGMSFDSDYYGGFGATEDVQRFEFTFAEGKAPLLQIARLLFPYMQVVSKEKGGAY